MNPFLFLWHCPFKHLYKSFKKWPLTLRSIEWLCAVLYCAELESVQYDTAQNLTPPSMILCRVNLEKLEYLEYLCENETKYENILTHYSVARADSNYKKGRKSCLAVLLQRIQKCHLTTHSNQILRGTWLSKVWYCAELQKNLNILAKSKPKSKLF